MCKKGVGECHPCGPGAYDEVVGFELLVHRDYGVYGVLVTSIWAPSYVVKSIRIVMRMLGI